MIVVRSIIYNLMFYVNLVVLLLVAVTTFVMPHQGILKMAELWGRVSVWLLRVVCGTKMEVRGLEHLQGRRLSEPLIIAAKHQSTWETFALLKLFDDYTFIVKRELTWIPLFGWFMTKARMIPVDRQAGSQALTKMTTRAREEIRTGRQLVIFPEGTRRAAGAEPRYRFGVAHLYAEIGVPCIPVALNSGLYWPRRHFRRGPDRGRSRRRLADPPPAGRRDPGRLFRRHSSARAGTGAGPARTGLGRKPGPEARVRGQRLL